MINTSSSSGEASEEVAMNECCVIGGELCYQLLLGKMGSLNVNCLTEKGMKFDPFQQKQSIITITRQGLWEFSTSVILIKGKLNTLLINKLQTCTVITVVTKNEYQEPNPGNTDWLVAQCWGIFCIPNKIIIILFFSLALHVAAIITPIIKQ